MATPMNRKLVGFDLLPEDVPPIPGERHDWSVETPSFRTMARENLRVTSKKHPGNFKQVLAFASRSFEKANPGMRAGQTDWLAEVVRLELRNPSAGYVFEMS